MTFANRTRSGRGMLSGNTIAVAEEHDREPEPSSGQLT